MNLATVVQALTDFAEEVESDYDVDAPAEALAVVLLAIRECRAGLAEFADQVERDLLALMDEKKLVIEGVGEIEAKVSKRRTGWDHDAMLPAIVSRITDEPDVLFDPDSGELLPYPTIGHNIARRLRECVSFGAGKVTGLRAIGMDPSEYCTEDEGHWSVKLPPRAIR